MTADVLFFGATADIVGERRISIEIETEARASEIFDDLVAKYPSLGVYKLHFSINQRFATGEEMICDKDELAIFTAVSGG